MQPAFEADLRAALDEHILAKVRAYSQYAAPFRAAVAAAGLGDGNLFQYVNFNVPWVTRRGWHARPGCYATHTEWGRGLQRFLDGLVCPGASEAYSRHLASLPPPVSASGPPPVVEFVVTHTGTGSTEETTGLPWI